MTRITELAQIQGKAWAAVRRIAAMGAPEPYDPRYAVGFGEASVYGDKHPNALTQKDINCVILVCDLELM